MRESFLYQLTISEIAYAIVPHIVYNIDRLPVNRKVDCILDISFVEGARASIKGALENEPREFEAQQALDKKLKKHIKEAIIRRQPSLPDDLADDYFASILKVRKYALDLFYDKIEPYNFRLLLSAIAIIFGHDTLGSILYRLDTIYCECSICQKIKVPDDLITLKKHGYV